MPIAFSIPGDCVFRIRFSSNRAPNTPSPPTGDFTAATAVVVPFATVVLTDSEDALYHAQKDSKDDPWEINYPTGREIFHVSKAQVTSLIKKIIREVEKQYAEHGRPAAAEDIEHASEPFSGR
jgi:hypothetical protein